MEKIIFDLDNTLISNIDFNIYVKKAFEDVNYEYNDEILSKFQNTLIEYEYSEYKYEKEIMKEYIKRGVDKNIPDKFFNYFLEELYYAIPLELENGLEDVLEYLFKKYNLYVLTNWFRESQRQRLINCGLYAYFDKIYGGEIAKKPNKEAFYEVCLDSDINQCIMIGDSYYFDYLGAKNAGLNAILIDKHNMYPNLENDRIKNIKELKKIL